MRKKLRLNRPGKCRAKRPYQAILWQPDVHNGRFCWSPTNMREFRNLEPARRQCERWMHSKRIQLTRYQQPRREVFADVRDIRTNCMVESFDVEIELVPSVGEIGVW